ncbi:MAG TPA: SLC13 family permease [Steroidobacteraceae bacterium]|nr:SLC13 family permease [Steroidobacteraceae bacterium]
MMLAASAAHAVVWGVTALATLGVLLRPGRLPEAIWPVAGALLLMMGSLLPPRAAWHAVAQGTDVYLFLAGMMLLAELARREGLFDWLAALAARRAAGDARRLFDLVYLVGIVVTMLLSNDATAVVLTPAVYAVARAARAPPLPYLYICAFIANAASFLLPIANPANLVVFGAHLPPLGGWLARFALPSVLAIALTYVVLRALQRRALRVALQADVQLPVLSVGGRLAAGGIVATAVVLLIASARGLALGLPTFVAGLLSVLAALWRTRQTPGPLLRGVSWGILPLVAGLFALVAALEHTGLLASLGATLRQAAHAGSATWMVGVSTALACNVANNLPVALIAGGVLRTPPMLPASLANVLLVAVDLGPNLSVTGSLASILWLVALRREGVHVSGWSFLRLGVCVMLPALLAALAALALLQH